MASPPKDGEYIEKFLLGELSPAERESFETEMWEDTALFERVERTEEALIGSYVRGEMRGLRRARFEDVYMATRAKRSRVEAIRVLHAPNPATASAAGRKWRIGAGLGVAAAAASVFLTVLPTPSKRTGIARVNIVEGLDRAVQGPAAAPAVLTIDATTGKVVVTVPKPAGRATVAEVTIANPERTFVSKHRPTDGSQITVELDAAALLGNHYLVELTDSEGRLVEGYAFDVVRK